MTVQSLRAGIGKISNEKVEEGPGRSEFNTHRKERLTAEAYSSIGHRCSGGDTRQIGGVQPIAAEVDHIARFGHRNVDAENSRIWHSKQGQQVAIQVTNRNDHTGATAQRQPYGGASPVGLIPGLLNNPLHLLG